MERICSVPRNPPPIRLYFEIEDTGPGIPPEDRESIFEAFYQSPGGKNKSEGAGLGLAISRDFVQLMGGDISITGKVGVGTIFKFDIPIHPVSEGNHPENFSVLLAPDQPPRQILIVEDNVMILWMLNNLLKSAGFVVDEAMNGKEAIAKYMISAPDLIWMNLHMPGMDGIEATKRIRALENRKTEAPGSKTHHRIPIIALTSDAFDETRKAILEAGCDDLLAKPFHNEDLFHMIQKYLGVRFLHKKPFERRTTPMEHEKILAEMAALPFDLFCRIEKDVIEGNRKHLLSQMDDLRPLNSALADVLGAMVQQFQYKSFLSLIQELRESRKGDED